MDTDDSSWIFDSLVCFLNGPVWNAPLQCFIEEKSLIFEPNYPENSEYRKIHNEFKNLVDLMLGSYMEDIGITPEQFEHACSKQYTNQLPLQFHQSLFEQIWAANDYEIFKRMMCQRNIELQLQALELIEKRYGIKPLSYSTSPVDETVPSTSKTSPIDKQEAMVFDQVVKQCTTQKKEKNISPKEDTSPIDEYQLILQKELKNEKEMLQKALQSAISGTEAVPSYEKNKPLEAIKDEEKIAEPYSPINKALNVDKLDESEVKKRQEYLKAQRDKLVAMKKQVREEQLKADIIEVRKDRPKSSKAATTALSGIPDNEARILHIRKALAEKLRNEVVSQKDSN